MSAARTFRTTSFGAPGITPLSLGIPAAAYPGRIATNSDLIVAIDRQQTSLLLPLSASDASMTVLDPSKIVAYNLLSIDNEIVKTTGAPAGNIVPISRGFDGTTPAGHLSGATVAGLVDAYHHNGLVAEIEAIESALGPNLANVSGNLLLPFFVSSNFDFPAQTPGGNLLVGNQVITLTPVPKGVNGSDTNHYLYISGGTGTAEAVLITGGTAISGAASGTVIVNCANTHSGAWTIRSATAGIQEAISALPTAGYGGGWVVVPTGTWTINSTITITKSFVRLSGCSRAATALHGNGSVPILAYSGNDQCTVQNIQLEGPGTGSAFAITVNNVGNLCLQDISIANYGQGISYTGNSQNIRVYRVTMVGLTGDAAFINSPVNAGSWYDCYFASDGSSAVSRGFHVTNTVGINITHCYTHQLAYGIVFDPPAGVSMGVAEIVDLACDGYTANSAFGILFAPAGGSIGGIFFYGGGAGGFSQNGINFRGSGTITDVLFNGVYIVSNGSGGIRLRDSLGTSTVKNITLTDCYVEANSQTTAGSAMGLNVQNASNVIVRGGVYGAGSYGAGTNNQNYGITVGGGTSNVLIDGCIVAPNLSGPIFVNGTNPGLVIQNAIGYNPLGPSSITVGASPFTYTAGNSREIVYISGGTVSNIKVGATTVAAASPAQITLSPNASLTVTYTVAPTMVKDIQ